MILQSPGGRRVVLGFGSISDLGVDFTSLGGGLIKDFQSINRLPDHKPPDSGQYGINVKLYLPNFQPEARSWASTSSITPAACRWFPPRPARSRASAATSVRSMPSPAPPRHWRPNCRSRPRWRPGAALGQQRAAQLGGNLSAAAATEVRDHRRQHPALRRQCRRAQAQGFRHLRNYGKTAGYYDEFPQDIKLLGVSFNTQIQKAGTALRGEVAPTEHNVPLPRWTTSSCSDASLTPFESGRRAGAG